MIARFEIYQDRKKEWRFRLRAPNGKIIAVGEGYTSKRNVLLGIDAVRNYANDSVVLLKK